MAKVKVSLDGKSINKWNVISESESEPHLVIQWYQRYKRTQKYNVVFDSIQERERYYKGVGMCRAKYEDDGYLKDIYLTRIFEEDLK